MKHFIVIMLLIAAAAAHAQPAPGRATEAVAVDAVTSGAALFVPGVVEVNPLGLATIPLRIAVLEHARGLPPAEGIPIRHAVTASSFGAAANNLLVLAGAGGGAPIIVGVIVGYSIWKSGEREREFWRLCEVHRAMAHAQLTCTYDRGAV